MRQQERPRAARRAALGADGTRDDRRGWLSHGLAALSISALGLVAAGGFSLTTHAEVSGGTVARTGAQVTEGSEGRTVGTSSTGSSSIGTSIGTSSGGSTSAPQSGAGSAFTVRPLPSTSRSVELRSAIVRERAAQRAEALAEDAERVTRAAQDQAGAKRDEGLANIDRQVHEAAVQLAWERQQRAIAARVAAEMARQAAESTGGTVPDGTGTDVTTIPTSGGSSSPVPGAVIGARFGDYGHWSRWHTGIDFRAAYGTPIRAVRAGVVLYAGNSGDWAGNHVAIRHADGLTTMSSHMSAMAVHAGQTVQAGQVIGYVGQTGRAFGAHLHFELYPVGVKYGDVYRAINPLGWLTANGVITH